MPTDIGFTGQRLDATGLMFFQARYLSPMLGRFISADTIVPGASNPQAFNRYSYGLNSPLNYIDPTGHRPCDEEYGCNGEGGPASSSPAETSFNGTLISLQSLGESQGESYLGDSNWIAELLANTSEYRYLHCREQYECPNYLMDWKIEARIPVLPGFSISAYFSQPGKGPKDKKEGSSGDRLPLYTGGKTRGILGTGTDEIDLISGRPTGEKRLPRNAPGSKLTISDHVEAQASAIMRNRGLMEADLYINKTPCPGKWGCNNTLPHMLPEGATLRVHIKHGVNMWEHRIYPGLPDSAYMGPG